jgi:proteasome accessory factor B
MAPSKVQRWLDIIAYLVSRRLPVSGDELMRNVPAYAARWASVEPRDHESARRGFERDKEELRALGIPIRTVSYNRPDTPDLQEAYVIERRDFYLPYLKLVQSAADGPGYRDRHRVSEVAVVEKDAPLALDALRRVADMPGFPLAREARSAFRKLAFDLDPQAFGTRRGVLFMERPGSAELSDRLRTLSGALLARKRISFQYHGIYRGEETSRDVAAYGLLFQQGHWYMVGHDALRAGVRVFRVGRMADVVANASKPNTPDYEVPDDFRLQSYVGREAWELGEPEEQPVMARVRFRFPLSLWAERNDFGMADSRADDGAVVRLFTVHQVNPFLRWLLALEGDAQVVEPEALREELRALASDIAAAHAEEMNAR